MKILVTGGAGYLGSVLVPKLLARGHTVRVLDVGYFGMDHLRLLRRPVELVRHDLRRLKSDRTFAATLLDGCDCIIHLAAVSNDPSAELNPGLTDEVNFEATTLLAESARERRIRFLFSSSCSIYGEAEGELNESSAVHPLTTYAASKVKAERSLDELADATWSPIVLRNGTLFGYSARMRFDLVVNIFSLHSTLEDEIRIFGDGEQWRPFLHVTDCARAFVHFAETPELRHRAYNIAHENLRVVDLAAIFLALNARLKVTHLASASDDRRNYRVSTERMREAGFRTKFGVDIGAEQIIDAILSGLIPDPESIYYRNAKWLKELSQLGSRDHSEIVDLMETFAHLRVPGRS